MVTDTDTSTYTSTSTHALGTYRGEIFILWLCFPTAAVQLYCAVVIRSATRISSYVHPLVAGQVYTTVPATCIYIVPVVLLCWAI